MSTNTPAYPLCFKSPRPKLKMSSNPISNDSLQLDSFFFLFITLDSLFLMTYLIPSGNSSEMRQNKKKVSAFRRVFALMRPPLRKDRRLPFIQDEECFSFRMIGAVHHPSYSALARLSHVHSVSTCVSKYMTPRCFCGIAKERIRRSLHLVCNHDSQVVYLRGSYECVYEFVELLLALGQSPSSKILCPIVCHSAVDDHEPSPRAPDLISKLAHDELLM